MSSLLTKIKFPEGVFCAASPFERLESWFPLPVCRRGSWFICPCPPTTTKEPPQDLHNQRTSKSVAMRVSRDSRFRANRCHNVVFAVQVKVAEAPHSAAVVRLQSAQALERVCVQEHLKKKEAADHLESKLEALVVRDQGGNPLFIHVYTHRGDVIPNQVPKAGLQFACQHVTFETFST